jgi:choline dehydrogenase-like flavoprotein
VIENGPIDNGPATSVPYQATILNTGDMYNITSAPEPYLNNFTFPVDVGNVVGGGTIVNGMAINRGADADYDAWEQLGNDGWGWEGLAPYFKKSTNYTAPSEFAIKQYNISYDPSAYGNGPVQISIPSFQYPDMKPIFDAWRVENISFPREGFAAPVGAYWMPNDIDNATATRSNAHVTYYVPVQSRPNLVLLTNTKVNRILFDDDLAATGVQIVSHADNSVTKVYANTEVILAAGGVFTPHLLMLSGIGPKDVLAAANITVKKDTPSVGSNFQDHVPLAMVFNLSNVAFPNPNTIPTNASFNASAAAQYSKDRSGPYSLGRADGVAFLTFQQFSSRYQNITAQISEQDPTQFLPERYGKNSALLAGYKKQREIIIDRYLGNEAAVSQFPIQPWGHSTVSVQKPLSRGTITLNTTDPEAVPVVFWNALSNPIDKAMLCELVRWNRVHWARKELARYSPVEITPGPQYQSDDEILEVAIKVGSIIPTIAHMSGGCSMMPEELGGCVSDKLLVYGVQKLSVVDASILPMIPAANLQATMYAVSEKAADIIKNR